MPFSLVEDYSCSLPPDRSGHLADISTVYLNFPFPGFSLLFLCTLLKAEQSELLYCYEI